MRAFEEFPIRQSHRWLNENLSRRRSIRSNQRSRKETFGWRQQSVAEKSSLMAWSMIYCIDWLQRHPSSLTRKLGDEGFISVGMRNAADATTLLQSLKPAVPVVAAAAQSSDGSNGSNSRGGSQSGKVRRRRSETAKFGLEVAAKAVRG